jgi:hypothetical protein
VTNRPLDLARELAGLFDELGIDYALGGSLASSLVGEPRSTVDIDFAVRLDRDRLDRLLVATSSTYYVPTEAAQRAVDAAESFNLIHQQQAWKIDLFVLGDGLLDRRQIERRRWVEIPATPSAGLWVTSTEDQILRKLSWFTAGGSDRQWRDVIAILEAQQNRLDFDDLQRAAATLGLSGELDAAIREVRTTD